MSRVLADVSPEFAGEQYAVLRNHFVDYHWGVPGVREYSHGTDGPGDVDSGPLIIGFSDTFAIIGVVLAIAAVALLFTRKTTSAGAGAH